MEQTTPVTPAPTQTTTEQPVTATRIDASGALDAMSPKQRDTWRETGQLPDSISVGPEAEKPVAAKVDDDAPAMDAKGQPITENGKPLSKRQQKINDYERRIAEQDQRIKALEARQTAPPKVEEKPAAEAAKPASDETEPAWKRENRAPVIEDYLDQPDPYLAVQDARWDWKEHVKEMKAQTSERIQSAAAEVRQSFTSYVERETAFKADHPDFDAKTLHIRQQLVMTAPLSRAVVTSDVAPALILHFAEHPEDFQRIGALGMSDMAGALRAIGRLEATYTTGEAPAAAEAQPKHVTSAPKPVTQLGTRSADAVDPVEGAIRRKDAGAYIRERNARDLAAAGK